MIDLIQTWPESAQQCFCWGCLVAGLVAFWLLAANVRIVLRGYPPGTGAVKATDCSHGENFTELCIKPLGNCATREECNREIESRSKGGAVADTKRLKE